MARTLSLPDDATRLVVAGLVTFWLLLFVAAYTVSLVSGPVRWLVAAAFVAIWASITVTWVRRTGDTESNIWGAVSRSQALG